MIIRLWRRAAEALVNRVAPEDMKHAAFLLGDDVASGYGEPRGLLSHLREFDAGLRIGHLYHNPDATDADVHRALELYRMERSLICGHLPTSG